MNLNGGNSELSDGKSSSNMWDLDSYLNESSARIKNIYIQLPEYEYFHSPSGVTRQDRRFIGREKVLKKLKTILNHSRSRAGAYLVTGYRGMGKTSLVRKVIAEFKSKLDPKTTQRLHFWGTIAAILCAFAIALLVEFIKKEGDSKSWSVISENGNYLRNPNFWFIWGVVSILLITANLAIVRTAQLKKSKEDEGSGTNCEFENGDEWQLPRREWILAKSNKKQLIELEISLSQEEIREFGFLGLLAKKLEIEYRKFRKPLYSYRSFLTFLIGLSILSITYIYLYGLVENFCYRNSGLNSAWSNQLPFTEKFLIGQRLIISTIFLILFWNSRSLWSRIIQRLGLVTHYEILKRLKLLTSRIEAQVSLEQGGGVDGNIKGFGWNWGKRRTQTFSVATTKEIEFELIDILNDVDNIFPQWSYQPQFIFVFDELDKIQLDHTTVALGASNESSNKEVHENLSRKLRERREKISTILANLKHFLNVAKAKFIFIAGREMFDASLADISDRDFFLGSIFHEIIYVESFLKDQDDTRSFGITYMIEKYLCRHLLSVKTALALGEILEPAYIYRLEAFFKAVLDEQRKRISKVTKEIRAAIKRLWDGPGFGEMTTAERTRINLRLQSLTYELRSSIKLVELLELRNRKVLAVLQNFVIFLVYRSNGTPKKLTNLFEKYIVNLNDDDFGYGATQLNARKDLIVHQKYDPDPVARHSGFYLKFNFEAQYQFGLIAYLFRPYLLSASQYMKSFGDKLLFSTAYLVDHLFKFHPWAFSWRTLELMPELVYANKSPELRSFIGKLLSSLQNIHIREIVYGVFEYKFYNKIRHEISFISKTQEHESAAFNFTLDESMHIKVHFQRRLRRLIEQYEKHPARQEGDYYQSLSFLHSTLGDIYYYDQEFDEALIAYSEAAAIYGKGSRERLSPHQMTNWIKARLKMGLVFEKMGANDDALTEYEGLLLDMDHFFSLNGNEDDAEDRAGFAKTLFENLRYFQLPFVAKLVMIEKEGISGISYRDIMTNEARMKRFLNIGLLEANSSTGKGFWGLLGLESGRNRETQEFLVRAYYHLNVGSVLYFKNGSVIHATSELEKKDRKLWEIWEDHIIPTKKSQNENKGIGQEENYKAPRSALMEYYKSFLSLTARLQAYGTNRSNVVISHNDPPQDEMSHEAFNWIVDRISKSIEQKEGDLRKKLKNEFIPLLPTVFDQELRRVLPNHRMDIESELLDELFTKNRNGTLEAWIEDNGEETFFASISSTIKILRSEVSFNAKTSRSETAKMISAKVIGKLDNLHQVVAKFAKIYNLIQVLKRIKDRVTENNPIYLFLAYGVWFFYLPYQDSRFVNKDKNILSTLALILSKMGDTLLCFVRDKGALEIHKWLYTFNVQDTLLGNQIHGQEITLPKIEIGALPLENNSDLVYFSSFFYLLSGQYYLKSGKPQNYEFQLRKILYLLKDHISHGSTKPDNENFSDWAEFLLLIRQKLVHNSLKAITWANEVTNRPQVFKQKRNYQIRGYSNDYDSRMLYDFVSNASETKETTLLYAEIELRLLQDETPDGFTKAIDDHFKKAFEDPLASSGEKNAESKPQMFPSFNLEKPFVTPYSAYGTKFMRLLELNFKVQCNFLLLFEKGYATMEPKRQQKWKQASKFMKKVLIAYVQLRSNNYDRGSNQENTTEYKAKIRKKFNLQGETMDNNDYPKIGPKSLSEHVKTVSHVIIESLFCLNEMIKIQEIIGQNYMTNYSYLGYSHRKLGDWCYVYHAFMECLDQANKSASNESDIRKAKKSFLAEVRKIVETTNTAYLEPKYHYELAVQHFYKAIEMHNCGNTYFQQIKRMHFLEDDFSDNMYHFSAAMERYKINLGVIRRRIEEIESIKNTSKTFYYRSYVNQAPWPGDA